MSITFIIPYYKLEKYLLMRCINSIRPLGNDFDWEIRIIDDGTPKSNASTWIKNINDKRIHYTYIEHQGLGGARNKGIEEATKEYIQMARVASTFVGGRAACMAIPASMMTAPTL